MHIDLSHTIEHGMITYKGLPAPLICDFLSREASRSIYAPGTEFQIGRIEMVANTGTYLDSPFHRFAKGKHLADLPLAWLAGLDGLLVQAPAGQRAIPSDVFAGLSMAGKAVLVRTDWDRHWRTDAYFEGHPFLTKDAAQFLLEAGVRLVGIDSYNIDDTADLHRPVHTILLGNDIPIVEHLTGPSRNCQLRDLGSLPSRRKSALSERSPCGLLRRLAEGRRNEPRHAEPSKADHWHMEVRPAQDAGDVPPISSPYRGQEKEIRVTIRQTRSTLYA
jgi:kynurenine formamidase